MAHQVYHPEGHCPAVNINRNIKPKTDAVKYLGLHFDCGLNVKEHIARERKRIDLKIKEINWLRRKKIRSNYAKQSGNQTDMELRNTTVGLCQQGHHSHHAEITIHNYQSHSKHTPVCNKSYSTYRLQHPLRK